MKKWICVLLFLLIWCAPALSAFGAEVVFLYTEQSDGTLCITGFTGYLDELALPAELDGKTVSAIADSAFMNRETLTSVTLPETVKVIGRQAFAGCINLTRVTLTGTEVLGIEAFAECRALRYFNPGTALTTIGAGAFEHCKLLGEFVVPATLSTIETDAFYGCEQLRFTCGDNTYAKDWAIAHNIPVAFTESDSFTLLVILALSGALLLVLWVGYRIYRKKRR